jgi:hypothetical protein
MFSNPNIEFLISKSETNPKLEIQMLKTPVARVRSGKISNRGAVLKFAI